MFVGLNCKINCEKNLYKPVHIKNQAITISLGWDGGILLDDTLPNKISIL
jgi:hypothetical protein